MAITYQTGSYVAAANFTTATVSNTTLVGAGSFSEEVTNLLAGGFAIGQLLSDGTNYVAVMIQKKWN